MDTQDAVKLLIAYISRSATPDCMHHLCQFLISATKADPIEREASLRCDYLDLVKEQSCFLVQKNSPFIKYPDSSCDTIRAAIEIEKHLIHKCANEARRRRAGGKWINSSCLLVHKASVAGHASMGEYSCQSFVCGKKNQRSSYVVPNVSYCNPFSIWAVLTMAGVKYIYELLNHHSADNAHFTANLICDALTGRANEGQGGLAGL